jgi:precorrin-6B methylase 2
MPARPVHVALAVILGAVAATAAADAAAPARTAATPSPAAAAPSVTALAQDRAACDQLYSPSIGQAGKDVVWVPTPDELVRKMLEMARTTSLDYVVDLGAGDGKIPIAAAKKFGARALGIEYDANMARLAQCYARAAGVTDRARIVQGDIFESDFRDATVVTMYLLPSLNLKLRPTLLAMRPGTRIVAHAFDMDEWEADEVATVEGRQAFLWIVPARVGGTWVLGDPASGNSLRVRLAQTFQKVEGEVMTRAPRNPPLTETWLRGDQLRFSYTDERGRVQRVAATVSGATMTGTITGPDGKRNFKATRIAAAP